MHYNEYAMFQRYKTLLDPKKRYLQIALNSTLHEAERIIQILPKSDRIIIEAGTTFIKQYGEKGIRALFSLYEMHLDGTDVHPYVVADLKTMDRAETEVNMAVRGGASAAIALGSAPIETLNSFVETCRLSGIDPMIDMMNVDFPLSVIRALKTPPAVVILHRGVDEEKFNREKQIPLHEIRRVKGNYDILIAIAGGDTTREVQRSVFNDADIVVVWKAVYQSTAETAAIVEGFLKEIK